MELLPKKKPILLKLIYLGILFLFIFSGVLGLYGYLWKILSISFAKTMARDFYLEEMTIACRSNLDCTTACTNGAPLGTDEACICLKDVCHYVKGAQYFSQAKFCESDTDCTVSCAEGPISTKYYAASGGALNDCTGGCADASFLQTSGKPNKLICRNRQCQYADGRTCFTATMQGSVL